jgi:Uma2 family endonuclease
MPQTKNIDQFKNNTIDLIVEVRSAEQFHAKHLRSKPNDYAGFGYIFGSKYQSWIN